MVGGGEGGGGLSEGRGGPICTGGGRLSWGGDTEPGGAEVRSPTGPFGISGSTPAGASLLQWIPSPVVGSANMGVQAPPVVIPRNCSRDRQKLGMQIAAGYPLQTAARQGSSRQRTPGSSNPQGTWLGKACTSATGGSPTGGGLFRGSATGAGAIGGLTRGGGAAGDSDCIRGDDGGSASGLDAVGGDSTGETDIGGEGRGAQVRARPSGLVMQAVHPVVEMMWALPKVVVKRLWV